MKTELAVKHLKPDFYEDDLPSERLKHYLSKKFVSIDTETRGLLIYRDRLCLIQLCDDEGVVSLVRYQGKDAPNIKKLLADSNVIKLFHYGRFDISVLYYHLKVWANPVWCTKIASKLVRTYTDRHSLKDLSRELLGLEMDKADQTSDWARTDLSESQLEYAANDVRYLTLIQEKLDAMLKREGRQEIATRLFNFLPTVCELDLMGFKDSFEH